MIKKTISNVLFIIFSFTCIFPVLWTIYTSFKTINEYNESALSLPRVPTLSNYAHILKTAKFGTYFINSAFVSIITLVLVIVLASLTGYFLSRFSFKGRNFIYAFFMLGMVVPTHAWLLPVFVQFKFLGLYDARSTLIYPYVAFSLPIAIFLMESFIQGIPLEMEESATLEGCSVWSAMYHMILPLCKPVLATITILTFNTSWNEFPFALVLINKNVFKTVPVTLTMFTGAYTTDYPRLIAALCIAILPVIALYLIFSANIMKGMIAGAVKG